MNYEEELEKWMDGDGYFDADEIVTYLKTIIKLKAKVEELERVIDGMH